MGKDKLFNNAKHEVFNRKTELLDNAKQVEKLWFRQR